MMLGHLLSKANSLPPEICCILLLRISASRNFLFFLFRDTRHRTSPIFFDFFVGGFDITIFSKRDNNNILIC